MPKSLKTDIAGTRLDIENHKIVSYTRLFECICDLSYACNNPNTEWTITSACDKLEKCGLTMEIIIETCSMELQEDQRMFVNVAWLHYIKGATRNELYNTFTSNNRTENMAYNIEERMRNCDNLYEFLQMMNPDSTFSIDMKRQIIAELAEQGIILLPEREDVEIGGPLGISYALRIRDHEVQDGGELFLAILLYSRRGNLQLLASKLWELGISYKAATKYCINMLRFEDDSLRQISWYFEKIVFSERVQDAFIVETGTHQIKRQIIEKITECRNWGELAVLFSEKSRFNQHLEKTVNNIMYRLKDGFEKENKKKKEEII